MPDINTLPPRPVPSTMSSTTFSRFVPPMNFAYIEDGVCRSGQPSILNISFLEALNLKTVIWMAVEEPNEVLLNFADEHGLTIHHLGLTEGGNPWDPLTEQCVADALLHIVDTRNYPLLICCGMGRHRTGTVVGCLRRLQGWNLAAALEEYRRFTGTRRTRLINELHIEAFQRDAVTLPDREVIPKWLWAVLE